MKLGYSIIIIIVVALGVYFIVKNSPAEAPKDENVDNVSTVDESMQNNDTNTEKNDGNLMMTVVREGQGAEAKNGDTLSMHYSGYLEDGTKFDSSVDRGMPFEFTLGTGAVIKGWDVGVLGMKVGEVRRLVIPSDMAYGQGGVPGVIPPGATLAFEVELLEIK